MLVFLEGRYRRLRSWKGAGEIGEKQEYRLKKRMRSLMIPWCQARWSVQFHSSWW